jgi:hypothetical protein
MTTYTVRYLDWSDNIKHETITVHQVIGYDNKPAFTAENLLTLGCGKYGNDHEDAIARLVLDHGTKLLSFTPV